MVRFQCFDTIVKIFASRVLSCTEVRKQLIQVLEYGFTRYELTPMTAILIPQSTSSFSSTSWTCYLSIEQGISADR